MRALLLEELNLVVGGAGGTQTITVVGKRQQTSYSPIFGTGFGGGGGASGFGGGGGGAGAPTAPHATQGVSAAANAFADAHTQNKGQTAADAQHAQQVHDDLAKLYDYAQAHPGDRVNIGNGQTALWSQVMTALNETIFTITDDPTHAGPNGAQTEAQGAVINIYFDPQNSEMQGFDANFDGTSGEDYQIFHEIGHAVNFLATGSVGSEASANTAGQALENSIGVPLMSVNGSPVPPVNGTN